MNVIVTYFVFLLKEKSQRSDKTAWLRDSPPAINENI
jgi:hypothetical protein